jgi:hypothetical protein
MQGKLIDEIARGLGVRPGIVRYYALGPCLEMVPGGRRRLTNGGEAR